MDYEALKTHLYDYNEDELFYRRYFFARQQPETLERFIASLNPKDVKGRRLLVPDQPEIMPKILEDHYFYRKAESQSLAVRRHDRYTPAVKHSHTFFEITYVFDGSCTLRINGLDISMQAGDLIFVPPEILHSLSVFNDSIVINVMIRRPTLHTLFYSFLNTENALSAFFLNNIYAKRATDYIIFRTGQDASLRDSFLRMLWENDTREQYHFQCICSTLMIDFFLLVRDYSDSIVSPKFAKRTDVQRYGLISYIQENYQNICIGDIAEKFHFTPEYTSRLIKETTGLTYTEIVLRVRMERAEEMLLSTNLAISAIAQKVGYDSSEHFIRSFRKFTGMSPTGYRKTRPQK